MRNREFEIGKNYTFDLQLVGWENKNFVYVGRDGYGIPKMDYHVFVKRDYRNGKTIWVFPIEENDMVEVEGKIRIRSGKLPEHEILPETEEGSENHIYEKLTALITNATEGIK